MWLQVLVDLSASLGIEVGFRSNWKYHIIISLLLRIEDLVATFVLLGITTNGPHLARSPRSLVWQ